MIMNSGASGKPSDDFESDFDRPIRTVPQAKNSMTYLIKDFGGVDLNLEWLEWFSMSHLVVMKPQHYGESVELYSENSRVQNGIWKIAGLDADLQDSQCS